jgi:predicted RNA-binding Zn-ribbon protein involved in translation (DUF1610 family)
MTTIRSTCPRCGEVDMNPTQVRLTRREGKPEYTFVCPTCGDFIVKRADRKIVGLLTGAGVVPDDEIKHPELFDLNAPALTFDDLIDFHRQLEAL